MSHQPVTPPPSSHFSRASVITLQALGWELATQSGQLRLSPSLLRPEARRPEASGLSSCLAQVFQDPGTPCPKQVPFPPWSQLLSLQRWKMAPSIRLQRSAQRDCGGEQELLGWKGLQKTHSPAAGQGRGIRTAVRVPPASHLPLRHKCVRRSTLPGAPLCPPAA